MNMNMENFHSGAPNLCRVCVDEWTGGEYSGRLYHCYSSQPEPIGRTSDVLASIDRLCDRLNYPARTQQPRHFGSGRVQKPNIMPEKVEPKMTREELAEKKGKMATFVVHVMYRQHSTWQGSVTWAETGEKANFRSALELIKLMDSAVDATMGEDPTQQETEPADPMNPVREETDHET